MPTAKTNQVTQTPSQTPFNYQWCISEETLEKVKGYQLALIAREKQPGKRLQHLLAQQDLTTPKGLSTEAFLGLLINTKQPAINAEQCAILGFESVGWNQEEVSILGDVSMRASVTVYDDGEWYLKKMPVDFEQHEAVLLGVPGALLRKHPDPNQPTTPDYQEVINADGSINTEAYKALYERRLRGILFKANAEAKESGEKILLTVPGFGCGAFAGDFAGKPEIFKALQGALLHFLTEHGDKLTQIEAVVFDTGLPVKGVSDGKKNEEYKLQWSKEGESGIPLITHASLDKQFHRRENHPLMLAHPKTFHNALKKALGWGKNLADCRLHKMIAWDHFSWLSNDALNGWRETDDGTPGGTNLARQLTGVQGEYRSRGIGHHVGYGPPNKTWSWAILIYYRMKSSKAAFKDDFHAIGNDWFAKDFSRALKVKGNVFVATKQGELTKLASGQPGVEESEDFESPFSLPPQDETPESATSEDPKTEKKDRHPKKTLPLISLLCGVLIGAYLIIDIATPSLLLSSMALTAITTATISVAAVASIVGLVVIAAVAITLVVYGAVGLSADTSKDAEAVSKNQGALPPFNRNTTPPVRSPSLTSPPDPAKTQKQTQDDRPVAAQPGPGQGQGQGKSPS